MDNLNKRDDLRTIIILKVSLKSVEFLIYLISRVSLFQALWPDFPKALHIGVANELAA